MSTVIKVDNISKMYQLGQISTGTISDDLKRWWAIRQGKEDPYLRLGEENDRTLVGKSNIVWSLKDISFEVEKGEIMGIVGRNGAGKSTLLKILSEITAPTSGNIKIKGKVASLLEVGTGFHPELSGRDNIFLNGAILGMRKAEIKKKFDEIVEFSGVERYIDTPVKRYSSGMYVRLAFAVAAHLESETLIVDEVLAVGDAEFQKKCLGKMNQLGAQSGRTIIFVSHNMTAIKSLCHSCLYMNKGRLISSGPTSEIITEYLTSNNPLSNRDGIIASGTSLHGSGEARFTKFLAFDRQMEKKNDFFFGEKITLKIELEAYHDLSNVTIGVHLLNIYGDKIAMIVQNNQYKPINVPKGRNEITVFLDEILMPGDYSFALSISHYHSGGDIDYIESFSNIKIDRESLDKDLNYPWPTIHGYFQPKVTWNIEKIL